MIRYRTLDGMRGIAALTVLLLHSQSLYSRPCPAAGECAVRFGHLAVDMFFALSGFVLSHRYDAAMAEGMKLLTFMRLRLVRLGPIYWLGSAIGAALLVEDIFLHGASIAYVLRSTAFNAILLPVPSLHAHAESFVLVPPAWSLFLEFWVANLAFAALGARLHRPMLTLLIALGALGLVAAALRYGNLDLGWYWGGLPGATARVTYSFFAGVAVRRVHARYAAPSVPAFAILAVLIASFFLRVPTSLSPLYELGCVMLLYPLLIYLGASAAERSPALGVMLGDISYAVYVIHVPLMRIEQQLSAAMHLPPSTILAAVTVLVILAAAVLVDAVFDRRARRILHRWIVGRGSLVATT